MACTSFPLSTILIAEPSRVWPGNVGRGVFLLWCLHPHYLITQKECGCRCQWDGSKFPWSFLLWGLGCCRGKGTQRFYRSKPVKLVPPVNILTLKNTYYLQTTYKNRREGGDLKSGGKIWSTNTFQLKTLENLYMFYFICKRNIVLWKKICKTFKV